MTLYGFTLDIAGFFTVREDTVRFRMTDCQNKKKGGAFNFVFCIATSRAAPPTKPKSRHPETRPVFRPKLKDLLNNGNVSR